MEVCTCAVCAISWENKALVALTPKAALSVDAATVATHASPTALVKICRTHKIINQNKTASQQAQLLEWNTQNNILTLTPPHANKHNSLQTQLIKILKINKNLGILRCLTNTVASRVVSVARITVAVEGSPNHTDTAPILTQLVEQRTVVQREGLSGQAQSLVSICSIQTENYNCENVRPVSISACLLVKILFALLCKPLAHLTCHIF
jgi:hypothetical protein